MVNLVAVAAALLCTQVALCQVPSYDRGKGVYKYMTTEQERANGISYLGSHERLRMAMDKLRRGENIHISTIGGSITSGQGCPDAPNWPQYVFNYMKDHFGEDKVKGTNGAIGGTVSNYMSVCHNLHVSKEADVIFVEYSINDWHTIHPPFENNARRSFERLLRKLMLYPNRPAVILHHAYVWYQAYPHAGSYWSNTEREFAELQTYYHLPALSLKAAVYQRMVNGDVGFQVDSPRLNDIEGLKNKAFYFDPIHPEGNTGARVMGELAINLLQTVYDELASKPIGPIDAATKAAALPRPMIPHNIESLSDKCFIGQHFTATVKEHIDWEWINESKTDRPKWGYIATKIGAVLKMFIDTRASAQPPPGTELPVSANGADMGAPKDPTLVLVELAYLKSYEHMGVVSIRCEGQCTCKETELNAHGKEKNSQVHLHNFYVSQAETCIVVVTVLEKSESGEHKFKLTGIMVSEETGEHTGIRNNEAVEYVGDISQRSADGTFNVNNHAR